MRVLLLVLSCHSLLLCLLGQRSSPHPQCGLELGRHNLLMQCSGLHVQGTRRDLLLLCQQRLPKVAGCANGHLQGCRHSPYCCGCDCVAGCMLLLLMLLVLVLRSGTDGCCWCSAWQ